MDKVQHLVDIAFHRWELAKMKAEGARPPLACSSDVACALPPRGYGKRLTQKRRAKAYWKNH